ncbi:MAG TPA: LPS export ABC transporter periplasmic protein LptC [Flavisolibacter sp.]|jgi:LPS export ABC transporter protein LptC|nr:LPS export ABC transporter periplasmic protein LptC [Flavisolibacter sp.]
MIKLFFYKQFLQAAFIISCLFIYSCENDPDIVNKGTERKANIEEAYKVESLLSQNGRLKARLIAPYMLRYNLDSSYLEFPKTLHVNFYDSTGKIESQLNALYGKHLESRNKVYLRDSVMVFNVKGDTLWAPELWWDQNTRKFYTDKLVRIRRTGQYVIGSKGMDAEQDLSDINVYQLERPSYITVPDSMQVD